ncbi:IPT/TIG domain-containing protein [Streptomyces inhibens]|uniref:IPT/TIG domain-containing protein n=1 Tax=Streptomyces inhibens TaxID=2293571 RepID=UPI001EE6A923|nr:IPT/TIG domain-containing protein [Streptomyces inhibens]UKY54535.1 IPT/TIG domain-containing protein [Streptomyces inhibens]
MDRFANPPTANPPTAPTTRTLTLAAPTVGSVSPASGPAAGGTPVAVTGTGFTGATAVRFGTTASTSFTLDSDTHITTTAPAGTGTVQVTVTTPRGTSAELVTYTYGTVTTPTLTSVSPVSGPVTGGTTVTLRGTGLSGATAVRFGATAATSFTVVSDTEVTAVAPAGSGTVQVTVVTPGGTSNAVAYTYSVTPAPTLSAVNPVSGPTTGGTTVTLTGSGLTTATAVRFGTTAATSFTVLSDTHISAVAPAGTGTVQVTVTTRGGTTNGIPFSYATTPVVSGVSPSQGPRSGGNTVTLTGTGLAGATAVTFGATPATSFTVVSPTQLTAVAPPGAAGLVDVTVTTPGGTSAHGTGTAYFYVDTPVLTSAEPSSGPVAGGTAVTLTGAHLIEATAVHFGNTAASSFTSVSDAQLTAVAPPGNAGSVQVTVTTAGGTSNGVSYTYSAAPVLTALSPAQGPLSGGNTVTLTGTGLARTTAVMFGTVPAAFTVISDSHLTATPPPGPAGPVDVTVTTPGGTSPAVTYTRTPPPTI